MKNLLKISLPILIMLFINTCAAYQTESQVNDSEFPELYDVLIHNGLNAVYGEGLKDIEIHGEETFANEINKIIEDFPEEKKLQARLTTLELFNNFLAELYGKDAPQVFSMQERISKYSNEWIAFLLDFPSISLSSNPVHKNAAENVFDKVILNESEEYHYRILEDGTAEIIDYIGNKKELVLPSELDGHIITRIGEFAFNGKHNVSTIVLPEGLREISDLAFFYCNTLASITFPSTLISIGNYTFWHCNSLVYIEFPENLKKIGFGAFSNCSGLLLVKIPDSVTSIKDVAFPDNNQQILIVGKGSYSEQWAKKRGYDFLFENTKAAEKIIEKTKSLRRYESFYYTILSDGTAEICGWIDLLGGTLRDIPAILNGIQLSSIGEGAFSEIKDLQIQVLPEGLTTIRSKAYSGCKGLRTIHIPDSVSFIAEDAFEGTDSPVLYVGKDSFAKTWAIEHGFDYKYEDSDDWLG